MIDWLSGERLGYDAKKGMRRSAASPPVD